MNTYNLYVDELVQVWKRTHINIEANSEKDAIDKYLNEEDYDDILPRKFTADVRYGESRICG